MAEGESPRMDWRYPTRESDPWWGVFEGFVNDMDVSAYASREDRSIIWGGGGEVSWDAATGTFTWTEDIIAFSPIGSRRLTIGAGYVSDVEDGGVVYVDLPRQPLENLDISLVSAGAVPSTDNAMGFGVRFGSTMYLRTGMSLGDGETSEGVAPVPGGGGVGGGSFGLATGYVYTQAVQPVEEVCGNGSFNGTASAGGEVYFKAAVTNYWQQTSIGEQTRVRLYDMGPALGPPDVTPRLVTQLLFSDQGGPRMLEQLLAVVTASPGANQILDTDRMYEVVVIQDPSTAGDAALLGSAGLEVR